MLKTFAGAKVQKNIDIRKRPRAFFRFCPILPVLPPKKQQGLPCCLSYVPFAEYYSA
jgi:hypothetical protein